MQDATAKGKAGPGGAAPLGQQCGLKRGSEAWPGPQNRSTCPARRPEEHWQAPLLSSQPFPEQCCSSPGWEAAAREQEAVAAP